MKSNKILNILLFVSIFSFFFSCEKTDNRTATRSLSTEKLGELNNEVEQRMYFSLLTNDEKMIVCSKHLDYCIEKLNLTNQQRDFLIELNNNLVDVYTNDLPEENLYLVELELQIRELFNDQNTNLGQLIFDSMISSDEEMANLPVPNPNDPKTDCKCSSRSNWCSTSSSGPTILCDKSKCNNRTGGGCGTLWGYSCNGVCNLFS